MLKKIFLIVIHIVLVVTFIKLFLGLNQNFEISDILGKNNAEVIEYNKYRKKYDDERMLYFIVTADKNKVLKVNDYLTNSLLVISGLKTVTSINRLQFLNYIKKDNRVFLKRFYKNGKLSEKGSKLLKEEDLFKNSYVSSDEKSILTSLMLIENISNKELNDTILDLKELQKRIKKDFNVEVYLLGSKLASFYFNKELRDQQLVISPISFLIIGIILIYIFKSFSILILGFYYIGIVFLTSGIVIFYFKEGLSPYTNFSLFFIYVMATSDFIHFSHSYARTSGKLKERLKKSVQEVIVPCFYTTLTTTVAFLSLGLSDIEVIRDFGVYSSIGIFLSFLTNFYFLPFVLKSFNININVESPPFLSFLEKNYIKHLKMFKWPFYLFFCLALIIFSVVIKDLNFDDNLYDKFVKSHDMTKSVYQFHKKFNFTGSIDLIRSTKNDQFLDLNYEKTLNEFLEEVEALPNVTLTRNLPKFLSYARKEMKSSPEKSFQKDYELQHIFDLMKRKKLLNSVYNPTYGEEKITINIQSLHSNQLKKTLRSINNLIKKYKLSFKLTGFAPIRLKVLNSIIDGFLINFLGTYIIIFLIFVFIFKSLIWAMIGMIPNTLPLVFLLSLLSINQTPVEDSLLLFLTAVIGISVDDTIHFLTEFKKNYKSNDIDEALKITFKKTYKALFTTTLIFIAIGPCYYISDLTLLHKMALLFNLGLILALVSDFYLLPNLLKKLKRNVHEA